MGGVELGLRQLADEPLGERPFLVADLRLGLTVDPGRVVHLVGEVQPLEEEAVLVRADRDRGRLAAPGERADGDTAAIRCVFWSAWVSTPYPRSPFFPAPK
jgi:hypothetical protein